MDDGTRQLAEALRENSGDLERLAGLGVAYALAMVRTSPDTVESEAADDRTRMRRVQDLMELEEAVGRENLGGDVGTAFFATSPEAERRREAHKKAYLAAVPAIAASGISVEEGSQFLTAFLDNSALLPESESDITFTGNERLVVVCDVLSELNPALTPPDEAIPLERWTAAREAALRGTLSTIKEDKGPRGDSDAELQVHTIIGELAEYPGHVLGVTMERRGDGFGVALSTEPSALTQEQPPLLDFQRKGMVKDATKNEVQPGTVHVLGAWALGTNLVAARAEAGLRTRVALPRGEYHTSRFLDLLGSSRDVVEKVEMVHPNWSTRIDYLRLVKSSSGHGVRVKFDDGLVERGFTVAPNTLKQEQRAARRGIGGARGQHRLSPRRNGSGSKSRGPTA